MSNFALATLILMVFVFACLALGSLARRYEQEAYRQGPARAWHRQAGRQSLRALD